MIAIAFDYILGTLLIIAVFNMFFQFGRWYEKKKVEKRVIGAINIDRSIPGEENLFFEVKVPISELSKNETVTVYVKNKNYME